MVHPRLFACRAMECWKRSGQGRARPGSSFSSRAPGAKERAGKQAALALGAAQAGWRGVGVGPSGGWSSWWSIVKGRQGPEQNGRERRVPSPPKPAQSPQEPGLGFHAPPAMRDKGPRLGKVGGGGGAGGRGKTSKFPPGKEGDSPGLSLDSSLAAGTGNGARKVALPQGQATGQGEGERKAEGHGQAPNASRGQRRLRDKVQSALRARKGEGRGRGKGPGGAQPPGAEAARGAGGRAPAASLRLPPPLAGGRGAKAAAWSGPWDAEGVSGPARAAEEAGPAERTWTGPGGDGAASPSAAAAAAAAACGRPRRRSQSRNLSLDSRSLGRAPRGAQLADLAAAVVGDPGRRRGALRELLGFPVGLEREDEQPAAGAAAAASAAGGPGGLCLEPREHAWMLAAAEGRFEALQELLEAEPGLLNRVDPLTGYSLHWLAKHGSHEGLIRIHDFARRHGLALDVSAPGSGGLTPLHLAAQQGHDLVIKVLVGALGADSSRRDHSGHRAYHYLRPDVAPDLRELAGAEESEETPRATNAPSGSLWRRGQTGNANNNCSIRRNSWLALPPERTDRGARGGDKASRVSQIQGFFRQLFSLFQDR
ncbi:LOW QUALITY PROTEIN: uncharacterized protein ACOB8E_006576 [Sarcophilus harrisii]